MCSSRGLCGDSERASRSSNSGNSGSHYALCALGVGLIALGIVMIVWTVVPLAIEASEATTPSPGNFTTVPGDDGDDESKLDGKSTSSVALVLVGAGVAMLLLSICLGVRNKRRQSDRSSQQTAAAAAARAPLTDGTGDQEETQENRAPAYGVPSYEEAVGSGQYPVSESNLRHSTSQLPSYEDIIAAVENEGAEPRNDPAGDTPPVEPATSPTSPAAGEALNGASPAAANANPNLPTRSSSRASRILRPLRIRRIKSDKLHLKDFRLHIRSPTQNPVTIEPITPPPQYDDKMPELG